MALLLRVSKKVLSAYSQPLNIKIHELTGNPYHSYDTIMGMFKRKAKGKQYKSPRILLRDHFNKHVGKTCRIFEGKASFGDYSFLQDREILIIVLIPKPNLAES